MLLDTIQEIYKNDGPEEDLELRQEKLPLELIECHNIEKTNNCEEDTNIPSSLPPLELDSFRDEVFEAEIRKADQMWATCLQYDCNPLTKLFVGKFNY